MDGAELASDVKMTSVLRRVPLLRSPYCIAARGLEGDVCVFQLMADAQPIVVEAVSGRTLMLAPGDVFLATPGYRESTRWVVGDVPDGGLVPGNDYWVLAQAGIVGNLIGDSPREKGHLGQVKFLGIVRDGYGEALNIRQFAVGFDDGREDRGAPLYLVLGTSAEVGKTTAGIAINQSLRQSGRSTVVVLKATGTSSLNELLAYLDFGAAQAFDCVDFGFPTTYPSERAGMDRLFNHGLGYCLSMSGGCRAGRMWWRHTWRQRTRFP